MAICVTDIPRPDNTVVAKYQGAEVATVHEAQGRKGLLSEYMRPIYKPAKIAGPAITCEVAPGDNWMIHVAVEQCQPGDVLVVKPTSPSVDGFFGDLLATSLKARGVLGLIIEGGVRDTATLTEMNFPVWSKAIFSQGCVKETIANVNVPMTCAGAYIRPGDMIVADEDGVVVVQREEAESVMSKVEQRIANEESKRLRFEKGELGLDIYNMRERLAAKGLVYVKFDEQ
ncbi:4-carboxy-4-hydroxy-2-oxoadipate aldolase/oxaloacetate decarboxylase [Alteromonas sp. CI.11.F.A3]|uniref:4-carboxy-4-hydroxy-2-oxoadipate aldolase/oxaloacetate decarboxylase n=1 Tax=unclassified Alteromonas TaxID=2614992 RepID=UPI001B3A2B01|nr:MULTISPECIES: 4-carboxy-4-hydroxy-2-oxoadipate aldolase/oxaloacetate decarboxylase [unclassified Alteromonas]MBQ4828458.1 4-carboxy-4-hydroxy-2-oxoadipate aldolase/oxaloacetate decarboxylase [Alteromonas sp. MMG017]WOI36394.1 4-carboxy-4-hydroxy-2-oxoadipate aldolase/oxaloacetate decarboxylase [Alteromonas sp. CI.11.F.A3]